MIVDKGLLLLDTNIYLIGCNTQSAGKLSPLNHLLVQNKLRIIGEGITIITRRTGRISLNLLFFSDDLIRIISCHSSPITSGRILAQVSLRFVGGSHGLSYVVLVCWHLVQLDIGRGYFSANEVLIFFLQVIFFLNWRCVLLSRHSIVSCRLDLLSSYPTLYL